MKVSIRLRSISGLSTKGKRLIYILLQPLK